MKNPEILEIKVRLQISKKPGEVFGAIVDPEQMSNYFISRSSGRMEEDRELVWRFPEFDMDVPIRTGKIVKDKYISYYWKNGEDDLLVEMTLEPAGDDSTIVTVTEKCKMNNEEGIAWLMGNTEGWANFLACLKAWLEYGINLRKGGFDFMREG